MLRGLKTKLHLISEQKDLEIYLFRVLFMTIAKKKQIFPYLIL